MNSACEIMRDSIVLDILPQIEEKMYEAYDTQDFHRYNYLTKCVDLIMEGTAIGSRNDVNEAEYWEGWRTLAINTLNTLEIQDKVNQIKKELKR
jgi:hypothetical protein